MHQRLRLREPGPHDSSVSTFSSRAASRETRTQGSAPTPTRPSLHSQLPPNSTDKAHLILPSQPSRMYLGLPSQRFPSRTFPPSRRSQPNHQLEHFDKPGIGQFMNTGVQKEIFFGTPCMYSDFTRAAFVIYMHLKTI